MTGSDPKSEIDRVGWERRFLLAAVCLGWLAAFLLCLKFEFSRLTASIETPAGALGWFANWSIDTTLPFVVFFALPVMIGICFWFHDARRSSGKPKRPDSLSANSCESPRTFNGGLLTSSGLFLLSLICSASIGMRSIELQASTSLRAKTSNVQFMALPPAYHDEFSYLLQARSFLAGRIAWPGMQVRPDLFHQIHVLNHPTTASRYFPLTGLWIAPFERMGQPYLGHWIAGALSCVFFHRCLLMMIAARWALVGGLLIAVSPGLAVFSNLLLAHHPTMLALSIFLWAFLRMMDSASVSSAIIAGTALSLAMLGRPMTAAGFAFPFGAWFFISMIRSLLSKKASGHATLYSWRLLLAMGLPIAAGFVVLTVMNHEITGSWTRSAYQLYTDTWTPRHRFGFNNVEIGSKLAGPETLEAYDRWATNLTFEKAIENEQHRLIASAQWTLGIPALLFLIIAGVPSCIYGWENSRVSLLFLSVVSLHAVHIPYWYDGILHWHYVFETAPLMLMLSAFGLRNADDVLRPLLGKRSTRAWLFTLVASCLLPSWFDSSTFWGTSRVSAAVGEQSFSRVRFEQFNRLTQSGQVQHPCLVMVDEGGSDVQLSYIVNPPDLKSEVLVCRKPATESELALLQAEFSDRAFYEFDPQTFRLSLIPE